MRLTQSLLHIFMVSERSVLGKGQWFDCMTKTAQWLINLASVQILPKPKQRWYYWVRVVNLALQEKCINRFEIVASFLLGNSVVSFTHSAMLYAQKLLQFSAIIIRSSRVWRRIFSVYCKKLSICCREIHHPLPLWINYYHKNTRLSWSRKSSQQFDTICMLRLISVCKDSHV